jgi:hypothetical protein
MTLWMTLVISVGTTTGYLLDDRGVGVRVAVRSRIFSSRRADVFPMVGGGPFSQGVKLANPN